jgi:hypothetical protein
LWLLLPELSVLSNRISRDSHVIYTEDIAVLAPLHKISSDLLKMRINTVSHVLETKDKFGYQYRIKASQMSIDKELAEFKKSDNTEAEQINRLQQAFTTYWREEAIVLKLSNENKVAEATERINQKLIPLANMIESIIDGLFTMSDGEAKMKIETNYTTAMQTIRFMLAVEPDRED